MSARRTARAALAAYGLDGAPLRLLRAEHNTTFRVGRGHVLRINRLGVHTEVTIASELEWLRALRAETGLRVPEPVAARDGALTVVADGQVCVLLRWLDGRFVSDGLQPGHMRQVARITVALHGHALGWRAPDGFARPRVDALTAAGKASSVVPAGPAAAMSSRVVGAVPAARDGKVALALIDEHAGGHRRDAVAAALAAARATTAALAGDRGAAARVPGDRHPENVLFKGGAAGAIDFDDCGWGFLLYDLATTIFELQGHPRQARLRDAFLDEYARHRPLPPRVDAHLAAFQSLRILQFAMWQIESRDHPAFRGRWRGWVRDCLDELPRIGSGA